MTQVKKNVITLKAFHGKTQGPLLISPVRDRITGRLRGVIEVSEEERRKQARPVTADTQRKISDGLQLDLDNEIDKTDWAWIKENSEISLSLEDAQSNTRVLFYVDLPDKEVEERQKRRDKRFEAETIIRKSSHAERKDLCRYLGQDLTYVSNPETEGMDFLLGKLDVKGGADQIINASADPKLKTKLFLFKLIDLRKITKRANGMLVYGETVIGLTVEAAVQWLDDTRNRDIVGKLFIELNAGDQATAGSVIEEFEADALKKANAEKIVGGSEAGEAAVGGEKIPEVVEQL